MFRVAKEHSKKFNTAKALYNAWEDFKYYCDNKTVTKTEFSQKESRFVTAVIPAPVTYTIKGFCIYVGMTEANFYATYNSKKKFELVIARMKEECEIDAREKFENNTLNSRLAGLWLSRYGYTTNINAEVDADMDLNVSIDYGEEGDAE